MSWVMFQINTVKKNGALTQILSSKYDEVYLMNLQACKKRKIFTNVVTCKAC